jgi:hypothetical protein
MKFLRRDAAARYITENFGIPCSPKTLAKLACVGTSGPPFRMVSRYPMYDPFDLDRWAKAKLGPLISTTKEHTQEQHDAGKYF